ncbi:MAG: decaprenyl-phosphate phosphoribosyltransferase [Thermoflexales bacterium]|nr:decaprenyl-phosphate phosphoribosyltransferase [Thermoflexales bacterium]MDW8292075.1 decaprenyl-phosphate phosphoribosyltransferase [Anaerolineae bacterium]
MRRDQGIAALQVARLGQLAWGLWRSMRPRQWAKNVFIFAPLVFDGKLLRPELFLNTLLGFVALSLLSSAVYLINDCADAPADRQHPKKRERPIARGDVPVGVALAWAGLLAAAALLGGYALNTSFALIAAAYFGATLAYTFWLKHVVLLDVFVLASGFVLRVAAGIPLVVAERFSPWLYTCAGLLALLIGFGKRRAELAELGNSGKTRAILAAYSLPLLDQVITAITGALIVSYTFYTFSAPQLPANHAMMLTVPFVGYALFRYLYLIHVKGEGGAPDELVFKDRPLIAAVILWALVAILALYVLD